MLTDTLIAAARPVAADLPCPLPAFLAVIEVESEGAPFEQDGTTPRLLFERHVFHRELSRRAPEKLAAARQAGLALPRWTPATQYKDQGASARRLDLLARARAIDPECAARACSWGLGQTMGFLAEELGYGSAAAMVAQMTADGIAGQLRLMAREIAAKNLAPRLAARDWAGFAARYNGADYARNRYDTRLAAACRRWERQLGADGTAPARPAPLHGALAEFEIRALQQRLLDLGYAELGRVDGIWGSRTTGAVSAFQVHEGLPLTGDCDPATRAALAAAAPRTVSEGRAATTPADLRAAGSQTVAAADRGRGIGLLLGGLGTGGGVQKLGLLDGAQAAIDQVSALRPVVEAARDLLGWVASAWWVAALVGGLLVWRLFGAVIARRLADQVSGLHA